MRDQSIGNVLVCAEGGLLGLVTERDIVRYAVFPSSATADRSAW
ncbi:hypothetical protein ACRJ4W_01505 [Streptomyces sp. GLT-R25]